MMRRPITLQEIEAARMAAGSFTYEQLRAWGVRCPPAAGWVKRLVRVGVAATCPSPLGFETVPDERVPAVNPLLAFTAEAVRLPISGETLSIYTDGSCDPNPGPGGWGFAVFTGALAQHEASGGENPTTNNRMELQAVIEALRWLETDRTATIWTDSAYVARGCLAWRRGWKRGNWSNAPERANADLWTALEVLLTMHNVEIRWVRGHAGSTGNDRADALAALGRRTIDRSITRDEPARRSISIPQTCADTTPSLRAKT